MSMVIKSKLCQVFSLDHLKETKEKISDLQHTCLYISKPCNPTTSYLYRGNRPKGILTGCGIITCYDYQTIEYIIRVLQTSPSEALTLLLDKDYVKRSAVVNMSWCRRIWSIVSRAHMIAVTGIYYSVLGGAFCSLGKTNSIYAYKACILATEQIRLAKRLKDPILESKCFLYFAEDLIQLGRINHANEIILEQMAFVESINDPALSSLLESVIGKMYAAVSRRVKRKMQLQ